MIMASKNSCVLHAMDVDQNLCASTSGQQSSDAWWEARQSRVTASLFGQVMRARSEEEPRVAEQEDQGPQRQ